jgi:hypothetical protein
MLKIVWSKKLLFGLIAFHISALSQEITPQKIQEIRRNFEIHINNAALAEMAQYKNQSDQQWQKWSKKSIDTSLSLASDLIQSYPDIISQQIICDALANHNYMPQIVSFLIGFQALSTIPQNTVFEHAHVPSRFTCENLDTSYFFKTAHLLVSAGLNINTKNSRGDTPLISIFRKLDPAHCAYALQLTKIFLATTIIDDPKSYFVFLPKDLIRTLYRQFFIARVALDDSDGKNLLDWVTWRKEIISKKLVDTKLGTGFTIKNDIPILTQALDAMEHAYLIIKKAEKNQRFNER